MKLTIASEAEVDKVFGQNVAQTFNPRQLLQFQYTKLLNYHGDEMEDEWAGWHVPQSAPKPAYEGLAAFMQDTGADLVGDVVWITKRSSAQPWGPRNFKHSKSPEPSLGAPYEGYLTLDGSLLTIVQASRILCIEAGTLVQLKMTLLYDELVVLEALKRMLRPRPEWPKIQSRQGGRGRSIRFV